MDPGIFEKIIAELCSERNGGLVAPEFHFIYTAHYNEILLYRHFEQMVQTLRKYGIKTYVLTNGVPLTPERTDIIAANQDVIVGICMNVPAFERDIWAKRSGMNGSLFDKLISNIEYAQNKLDLLASSKMVSIQINGAVHNSFWDRGGWLTKEGLFPSDMDLDVDSGELATQFALAQKMFPKLNVYPMPSLIDRAGLLKNVISNKVAIDHRLKGSAISVVGCGNGCEVGGRPFGWLHVNARGDAFLCCNDYNFDYTFGNLEIQSLRDIWVTDRHASIIEKSFKEICINCASSVWK